MRKAMPLAKRYIFLILLTILFCSQAIASDEETASYHFGFIHPNGLDMAGYSVEKKISEHTYKFYTFGIPSFAAIGVSYYHNYSDNGMTATASLGLGTLFSASVAYQFKVDRNIYFKLGASYTSNIAYNGFFPVLSYEQRFKH